MLGTILSTFQGAVGAAEFGKMGMLAGGGVGIASDFIGGRVANLFDKDEDGIVNQSVRGFLAGSTLSAFSSAQELYAFHNPNSIQGVSSINSTTSVNAEIDAAKLFTNASGRENLKSMASAINEHSKAPFAKPTLKHYAEAMTVGSALTGLRPDNLMIDLARVGMINEEAPGRAFDDVIRPIKEHVMDNINGIDGDGVLKTVSRSALSGLNNFKNNIIESVNIADNPDANNPWLNYGTAKDFGAEVVTENFGKGDISAMAENRIYVRDNEISKKGVTVANGNGVRVSVKSISDFNKRVGQSQGEIDKAILSLDENISIYEEDLADLETKRAEARASIGDPDELETIKKRSQMFLDITDEDYDKLSKGLENGKRERDDLGKKRIELEESRMSEYKSDGGEFEVNGKKVSEKDYYKAIVNDKSLGFKDSGFYMDETDDSVSWKKDYELKEVSINADDDMKTRTSKYIDRYAGYFDEKLGEISNVEELINSFYGTEFNSSDIKDANQLKKYIGSIDPGALGTYKEVARTADEADSFITKTIRLFEENKSGSPMWARELDKQMKAGEAVIESFTGTDKKGRAFKSNKIVGGSKVKRMSALGGDIGIGGVLMAAGYAIPAILSSISNGNNNIEHDLKEAERVVRRE